MKDFLILLVIHLKENLKMDNDVVLETNNLTKYYGKSLALDHLNFKIKKGSIYGLLGRNGAGKTTAIKLMLGLLKPTQGSSKIFDCNSQDLSPKIRERVGYVAEGHHLYRWMNIKQLRDFQKVFFPDSWDDNMFDDMINYFGLPTNKKIKHFSNGQKAQVSLALAMAPDSELLIMDDPTLGLDATIRRQFLEGAIQLIQKKGKSILFSSHILSDVERVADRIAVIDRGVLRADCSVEQFQDSIKKVIFKFKDSVPQEIDIHGLLHSCQSNNSLELTLVGTTVEQLESWSQRTGALNHKHIDLNLEDQFIEFTQPQNANRLFQ